MTRIFRDADATLEPLRERTIGVATVLEQVEREVMKALGMRVRE